MQFCTGMFDPVLTARLSPESHQEALQFVQICAVLMELPPPSGAPVCIQRKSQNRDIRAYTKPHASNQLWDTCDAKHPNALALVPQSSEKQLKVRGHPNVRCHPFPAKKLADCIQNAVYRAPLAHVILPVNHGLTCDGYLVQAVGEKREAHVAVAKSRYVMAVDQLYFQHVKMILFLAGGEHPIPALG